MKERYYRIGKGEMALALNSLLLFIIPSTTQTEAWLASSPPISFRTSWSRHDLRRSILLSGNPASTDENFDLAHGSANEAWELNPALLSRPYVSPTIEHMGSESQSKFFDSLDCQTDPLWEQIKLEAKQALLDEPSAGPQVYTRILSQKSLLHALIAIVSHEIETELMPATSLQNLFFEMLDTNQDSKYIALDVMASTMRSPSSIAAGVVVDRTALFAVLFHQGLHALVCHRLSHRLCLAGRTGLSYYFQSTLSRKYSADIHPAAKIGPGIYLNAGSAGVVIGETTVVEQDVTILQGVTLGGTGKERGDRHPKVARGALLQHSCSVLGNITVGEGAIITAKSIVTKPVPPFARVSGVPAKVKSYRQQDDGLGTEGSNGYGRSTFIAGQQLSELEIQMRNMYLQSWNEECMI